MTLYYEGIRHHPDGSLYEKDNPVEYLRWLLHTDVMSPDGTWGPIFARSLGMQGYPPNHPTRVQHELGGGWEHWAQPLVQLYFAFDSKTRTFDYEPDQVVYTGKSADILVKGAPQQLEVARCGSSVDDLIDLIVTHPDAIRSGAADYLLGKLTSVDVAEMMGCISTSSALAFAKQLRNYCQKPLNVNVYEFSRTISSLIVKASQFFRTEARLNIRFTETLEDLGDSDPQFIEEYVGQYLQSLWVFPHNAVTVADIVEYYMTDKQITEGLGPRLRQLGLQGPVLIRAMAQYNQIASNQKLITADSMPISLTDEQEMLFQMLMEAGFTVSRQEFKRQLDTMFGDSPAPLRAEYMEELFYDALEAPRPGSPSLRPIFSKRVAKHGMDPMQRHYVLLAYEAVE